MNSVPTTPGAAGAATTCSRSGPPVCFWFTLGDVSCTRPVNAPCPGKERSDLEGRSAGPRSRASSRVRAHFFFRPLSIGRDRPPGVVKAERFSGGGPSTSLARFAPDHRHNAGSRGGRHVQRQRPRAPGAWSWPISGNVHVLERHVRRSARWAGVGRDRTVPFDEVVGPGQLLSRAIPIGPEPSVRDRRRNTYVASRASDCRRGAGF